MRLQIAGHPLHPALVHFPVALWFTAVFWDLMGWWRPDPLWWQMAYWCLALGLVVSVPVLITGFLDYLQLEPRTAGIDAATNHMMAMLCTTAAFGTSWMLRALAGAAAAPSVWALVAAVVGALLLGIGGWLGGTLVYRHGIGRARDDSAAGRM